MGVWEGRLAAGRKNYILKARIKLLKACGVVMEEEQNAKMIR